MASTNRVSWVIADHRRMDTTWHHQPHKLGFQEPAWDGIFRAVVGDQIHFNPKSQERKAIQIHSNVVLQHQINIINKSYRCQPCPIPDHVHMLPVKNVDPNSHDMDRHGSIASTFSMSSMTVASGAMEKGYSWHHRTTALGIHGTSWKISVISWGMNLSNIIQHCPTLSNFETF